MTSDPQPDASSPNATPAVHCLISPTTTLNSADDTVYVKVQETTPGDTDTPTAPSPTSSASTQANDDPSSFPPSSTSLPPANDPPTPGTPPKSQSKSKHRSKPTPSVDRSFGALSPTVFRRHSCHCQRPRRSLLLASDQLAYLLGRVNKAWTRLTLRPVPPELAQHAELTARVLRDRGWEMCHIAVAPIMNGERQRMYSICWMVPDQKEVCAHRPVAEIVVAESGEAVGEVKGKGEGVKSEMGEEERGGGVEGGTKGKGAEGDVDENDTGNTRKAHKPYPKIEMLLCRFEDDWDDWIKINYNQYAVSVEDDYRYEYNPDGEGGCVSMGDDSNATEVGDVPDSVESTDRSRVEEGKEDGERDDESSGSDVIRIGEIIRKKHEGKGQGDDDGEGYENVKDGEDSHNDTTTASQANTLSLLRKLQLGQISLVRGKRTIVVPPSSHVTGQMTVGRIYVEVLDIIGQTGLSAKEFILTMGKATGIVNEQVGYARGFDVERVYRYPPAKGGLGAGVARAGGVGRFGVGGEEGAQDCARVAILTSLEPHEIGAVVLVDVWPKGNGQAPGAACEIILDGEWPITHQFRKVLPPPKVDRLERLLVD